MDNLETFVVRKEWLDNIEGLPIEQQDKIIAELVRYGVGKESVHTEDATVQAFVNMVKGSINASKNNYLNKITQGGKGGRKKMLDDARIYELAQKGYTAQAVADELGYSKSAVDKSEGWKNRKVKDFVF